MRLGPGILRGYSGQLILLEWIMRKLLNCSIFALLCPSGLSAGADTDLPACGSIDIPILRTEGRPSQYEAFCRSTPDQCVMSGDVSVELDRPTFQKVNAINQTVNRDVVPLSDIECYGREELWTLPEDGYGDCEDVALEKRRLLVEAGLPSAALTLAIVHHKKEFFPHAVLLLKAHRGTYILDSQNDDMVCWAASPYEFERRERPDGTWSRFVRPN